MYSTLSASSKYDGGRPWCARTDANTAVPTSALRPDVRCVVGAAAAAVAAVAAVAAAAATAAVAGTAARCVAGAPALPSSVAAAEAAAMTSDGVSLERRMAA